VESKANNSSAPSAEGKAHGVKINCCMEIIIRKGGLGDVGSTKKR